MREKTILARNIQRLRKARGWTQDELADASGISMPAIRAYENDLREPNCKALVALERVFQVTGAQLYGLEPMDHQGAAQAQEESGKASQLNDLMIIPGEFSIGIDTPGAMGDNTTMTILCSRCGEIIFSGALSSGISNTIGFRHSCHCSDHRKAVG